ncbi:basic proline-rich protein-like [Empidonax traillii]|uniref:basic proline-rich protein-like n=1 Tax=Empidonax traillii TaxID=164674 RepID=UPI000FFD3CE1|nr:basic proline-rich protein-like [Empidonax traillii]
MERRRRSDGLWLLPRRHRPDAGLGTRGDGDTLRRSLSLLSLSLDVSAAPSVCQSVRQSVRPSTRAAGAPPPPPPAPARRPAGTPTGTPTDRHTDRPTDRHTDGPRSPVEAALAKASGSPLLPGGHRPLLPTPHLPGGPGCPRTAAVIVGLCPSAPTHTQPPKKPRSGEAAAQTEGGCSPWTEGAVGCPPSASPPNGNPDPEQAFERRKCPRFFPPGSENQTPPSPGSPESSVPPGHSCPDVGAPTGAPEAGGNNPPRPQGWAAQSLPRAGPLSRDGFFGFHCISQFAQIRSHPGLSPQPLAGPNPPVLSREPAGMFQSNLARPR